MKKSMLLLAVAFLGCLVCNVYAETLQKDQVAFVRSDLRAEGTTLVWHNMSSLKDVIPAGTEVKIVKCAGERIIFVTPGNNKKYVLVANAAQWDKYLVKDKNEIKPGNAEITTGMSKEAVYTSKGCPAYIAWGKKSYDGTLADIMQSDTWYYLKNSRDHDKLIKFSNGVVSSVDNF